MRFTEFKPLREGSKSDALRYNSEVGMLAALAGADITNFDPKNPQNHFQANVFADPQITFKDIVKFLAPNYDAGLFQKYYDIGLRYKDRIAEELNTLQEPMPDKLSWSGGSNINPDGAADIIFAGHPTVHGVSIKAETGITLRNLTAQSVGLTKEDEFNHPDVFARFAEAEWNALKKYAIQRTLEIAQKTPGTPYAPIKPKYQIVYHATARPAPAAKTPAQKATKVAEPTPAVANQTTQLAVSKQTIGSEPQTPPAQTPQPISEAAVGYYEIFWKGKTANFTEEQIYAAAQQNAEWQRVFGDHVQSQWKKDAQLRQLGDALFSSIAEMFVQRIESTLAQKEKLHKVVAMGKLGYFYANPTELYFVPGVGQLDNLKVKSVVYGAPDGTAQKFIAKIGIEGGTEDAQVLVYVRYANGMFEANPTVRIQDLKNPTGLTWTKLI